MPTHETATRQEWLDARRKLLAREKELTRLSDELARRRQVLPYHTYGSFARGGDLLMGAYQLLDRTPRGRDEDGLEFPMAWVRRRDEYDTATT